MRVRPEQLERRLARGLASVYVVHGDEPLQREESLDAIRAAARAAGFAERIVLHAESDFDWNELRTHAASLSLFAERRLIDLRVPGSSPGKDGGPALAQYASNPPPDMVLLLSCGRLDRRSTGTKWFKALEGAGDVVEVYPVRAHELPRWIAARSAAHGLAVERDAAEALAERNEGNLLACAQEIDKLRLLCEGRTITVDDVMRTVADSARFGTFDLIDPALEGNGARALRILQVLREEGVEPFHVLGSLTWAIRGVCAIAAGLEGGAPLRRCATDGLRRMVEQEARPPARPRTHAPPRLDRVAGRRRRRRPVPERCAGALRGFRAMVPRRRLGGSRTAGAGDERGETTAGRPL